MVRYLIKKSCAPHHFRVRASGIGVLLLFVILCSHNVAHLACIAKTKSLIFATKWSLADSSKSILVDSGPLVCVQPFEAVLMAQGGLSNH
ncbi:hypothetical protein Plhal304r1_c002g0008561 [Plasmopara halstedii]